MKFRNLLITALAFFLVVTGVFAIEMTAEELYSILNLGEQPLQDVGVKQGIINGVFWGDGVRYYNGSNYNLLAASSSLSSDVTFYLPTATGTDGQVLTTYIDGSLYWSNVSSSGGGGGGIFSTTTLTAYTNTYNAVIIGGTATGTDVAFEVIGNVAFGTIASGTWSGTAIADGYIAEDYMTNAEYIATTTHANLSITESQISDFDSDDYLSLSVWYATTTDGLAEGSSNLYMTEARWASYMHATTTDALSQGSTNLYLTEHGWAGYFHATTTTGLSEGTNLYFTDQRVADYINGSSTLYKSEADLTSDLDNNYIKISDYNATTTHNAITTMNSLKRYWSFRISTSTIDKSGNFLKASATGTLEFLLPAVTVTKMACDVSTSTLGMIIGDGTNWATYKKFTTTAASQTLSSNNSFTDMEGLQIEAQLGSVDAVAFCYLELNTD